MEQPPAATAGPERSGDETMEGDVRPVDPPRIYVASLSDYNAGFLHGVWLDADQEPDEMRTAINEMLDNSPSEPGAEEFAVHDHEGFGDCHPGEYDSLDWISRVAKGIREHGRAFGAWAARCDNDDDRLTKFDEAFLGEWDSLEAYTEELLTDLGYVETIERAVPDYLQPYVRIDFAAFANDIILGGDLAMARSDQGGVWLFETMN